MRTHDPVGTTCLTNHHVAADVTAEGATLGVDEDQWLAALNGIVDDVSLCGSEPARLRPELFGLWLLFMRAPSTIQRLFEQIDDDRLTDGGTDRATAILQQHPVRPPNGASLADAVEYGATLLRGLEQVLIRTGAFARAPRRAAELETAYRGEAGYVLPFTPAFREPREPWQAYFPRRGLAEVRCLRKTLESGHKVNLVIGDPPRADDETLHCVAALFESVVALDAAGEPIDFETAGRFVFHDARLSPDSVAPLFTEALEEAPADIVVFPELTMPPQALIELVSLLRTKPWLAARRAIGPALIVGGSWHRSAGSGKYRNQAPVLRSNGEILGWHSKSMPFRRKAQVEDIEPSNEVLVVATPTLTVAIAICLDFCQAGGDNVYSELDVDLVLVPSMGGPSTMDSHRIEAKRIWDRRKTATFVAQQSDEEAYGYVFSQPGDAARGARASQRISRRSFVRKD